MDPDATSPMDLDRPMRASAGAAARSDPPRRYRTYDERTLDKIHRTIEAGSARKSRANPRNASAARNVSDRADRFWRKTHSMGTSEQADSSAATAGVVLSANRSVQPGGRGGNIQAATRNAAIPEANFEMVSRPNVPRGSSIENVPDPPVGTRQTSRVTGEDTCTRRTEANFGFSFRPTEYNHEMGESTEEANSTANITSHSHGAAPSTERRNSFSESCAVHPFRGVASGAPLNQGGDENNFANDEINIGNEVVFDENNTPMVVAQAVSTRNVNEEEARRPSVYGVAVASKDNFKEHLLRSRRTQVGLAVLVLLVAGLAVGLGIALSEGSTELPPAEEVGDFWVQVPPNIDGQEEEGEFGTTVSMNRDGTRVAVGAPGVWDSDSEDADFLRRGLVEVHELKDGDWARLGQQIRVTARDDRGDILMPNMEVRNLIKVALSSDGDAVAVGSSFHDTIDKKNVGQVEVFRLVSGTWEPVGDPIVGANESDYLGASVSLSEDGGILAVGAPGNDDNGEDTGAAKVFFLNKDSWDVLGSDDIRGVSLGEMLGGSVSLSADGKYLAVGSSSTRDSDNTKVAKVFKFRGGDWKELGSGIEGGGLYDTAYDAVLSADGSKVVISNHYIGENGPEVTSGENNTDLFVGAFEYVSEDWEPLGENLHPSSPGAKSGYFVTLSDDGNIIGMGDPGRSVNGGKISGHAHIYLYDESGAFNQVGPNINGGAAGDRFGYEVSISGDGRHYAIGAPSSRGNGFEHGRVQVYKIPESF